MPVGAQVPPYEETEAVRACRLATAHPDTPGEPPPKDLNLSALEPLIRSFGLPFVTADLARRDDGTWRLIELGDGQVSDRPATTETGSFLNAIITLEY